jgi:hypothetical protein
VLQCVQVHVLSFYRQLIPLPLRRFYIFPRNAFCTRASRLFCSNQAGPTCRTTMSVLSNDRNQIMYPPPSHPPIFPFSKSEPNLPTLPTSTSTTDPQCSTPSQTSKTTKTSNKQPTETQHPHSPTSPAKVSSTPSHALPRKLPKPCQHHVHMSVRPASQNTSTRTRLIHTRTTQPNPTRTIRKCLRLSQRPAPLHARVSTPLCPRRN